LTVAPPRPHAVVIGAGFGGLAAAVRLGARGYRVSVLERLDRPGGGGRMVLPKSVTFDAGPTIVTAPFLLEELWRLCGRRLSDEIELRPLDPFYRLRFDDGSTLDVQADDDAMRAAIARLSPGDVAGWDRYMAESAAICRVGFEQLGHRPFDRFADMLRQLPALLRLGAHRTVYGHAAACVRDPRLRMALSFHPLFVGGNPFSVTRVYSLIAHLERHWGVHFAMGGTGRLVDGLVGLIEGQGGRVRLGQEVAAITVRDGRARGVRLASGETVAADVVVSNADPAWTYGRLLPAGKRRRWTAPATR
jgi:phytoene desaturase